MAHVVLPSTGFAEKTGSMINGQGRLQRMTRAVAGPGESREDWMILRDLRMALTGGNSLHSVEDIWKAMSVEVPLLAEMSWAKIGDFGIQLKEASKPMAAVAT